jgi:threonine dehydratase
MSSTRASLIPPEMVARAGELVASRLSPTPVLDLGDGIHLKLDCLQPTGSFKVRGFHAAALGLSPAELARGLITVSAGNAGMACAFVAHQLGTRCRVVMYDSAPAAKIAGVRRWGGEPVLMPRPEMLRWMEERGWESEPETFIHSFADERLIAGHASAGLELLRQVYELGRVVVPVGGGGLVTGIASAVKAEGRDVEVVGVQSDGYALWPLALAQESPPQVSPATIADGTTAPFHPVMRERLRAAVDHWVVVPEPRLREAVKEIALTARVVAEGAGALAFAALDQLPRDRVTAVMVSGGNIDPVLLADLLG